MAKLHEMMQERAQVTASLRALMDKYDGKEMSADDKSTMANMEARFDELNEKINAEQKQLDRERKAGEIAQETVQAKRETNELFAKALTGDPNHINAYRAEMVLGTDATAGFLTAPVEFVNRLIVGLNNEVFMRQLADVVGPIGQAQSLGFPTVTTDASDVTWTTEVAQAPEETTLTFGRREFKPNRLAKRIKVSETLIRHAPNPEQTILSRILYKVGVAQEAAYMTGSGTNQPLGIFTASNNGIPTSRDVTAAGQTAITVDDLINAKYSVKGQYMRNASWIMHRDLCKMVAKLKGDDGQYIWQPSAQLGQPDTLLGAPVYMSEYAPNTYTAGNYVAVYGDFKAGYWICDADGLFVKVLNELYAEYNEIGYIVHYFGDGAPVLPEAFARVKLADA